MRVERFGRKADALSFITKGFSSYLIHIEHNFDLDTICSDKGKGKPHLVCEWINNLKRTGFVTGHKCVPDIV